MNWLERLIDRFRYPKPAPAPRPPDPTPASPDSGPLGVLNAVRKGHGLPPLLDHAAAAGAAEIQAEWQADRDRIGHDGPDGLVLVSHRLEASGLRDVECWTCGEVCAQGEVARWPDGSVAIPYNFGVAVRDWLNSPGHRRVILDASYTHAGAATRTAASGRIYCTAVFVRF